MSSASFAQESTGDTRKSTETSETRRSSPRKRKEDDGTATSRSAVSSLRLQLNRRSHHNKRGSVSDIFRRSGSRASSVRGARGPDEYYRNSQDLSRTLSPLGKANDHGENPASLVPLPSSPIAIPSPAIPTLKLDFGSPASLSPFPSMTESDLADIKALQDPRNITTGVPQSNALDWDNRPNHHVASRRESVFAGPLAGSLESKTSAPGTDCFGLTRTPFCERNDPFRQESPMPGTTLPLEMDDVKCVDQQRPLSNGAHLNPAAIQAKPDAELAPNVHCHEKVVPNPLEYPATPTSISLSPCFEHKHEHENTACCECQIPVMSGSGASQASQPANSDEDDFDRLFSELQVSNLVGDHHDLHTELDDDSSAAILKAECMSPAPLDAKAIHRDALAKASMAPSVAHCGPPSPGRAVQLPLRPKPALSKHSSYDSMIFKPILDRLAAKKLGVFRPGSDPTLRQKYFPQVTIGTATVVTYPRQASLDSRASKTSTKSKGSEDSSMLDDSAIFERAVESPSPLQIRKQAHESASRHASSPRTPKDATSAQTPGSSPDRTPSMGDRQLFDLQRAERNARYNAIHSGSCDTVVDDDSGLHLADFDHAGPGSRVSTPRRNSGERTRDRSKSPPRWERVTNAWPDAQVVPTPRKEGLLALSRD